MPTETQDDVVLSSTAVETKTEAAPVTPAAPAKDAKTEAVTEAATTESTEGKSKTETAKTETKSEEGKPEEKGEDEALPRGVQKRLDKLTARLKAAEEALEEASKTKTAPPKEAVETVAAANADPKPTLDDIGAGKKFATYEDFIEGLGRWAARQERQAASAKDAETAQASEAKKSYDAHLGRVVAARTKYADFDEAIESVEAIHFASEASNRAFQVALVESPDGADIIYHLSKHPETVAKIAALPPSQVLMEIGRISASLLPSGSTAAPKTPTSKAPEPITPVTSSTTTARPLNDPDIDTDEFIRRRRESQRRK